VSEQQPAIPIPLQVRHWPGRGAARGPAPARPRRDRNTYLVFDTETTTDRWQELMVGGWRLVTDGAFVEQGLFYPDDLPETDPAGFEVLRSHVAQTVSAVPTGDPIRLMPLSWWLNERLLRYGYRTRATVVGHNLPFDLGRIAAHWGASRSRYSGGWTLYLWGHRRDDGRWQTTRYRPDLRIRPLGEVGHSITWAALGKDEGGQSEQGHAWAGRWVDTAVASGALTGSRGRLPLEKACAAFGVPFTKADVGYGRVTPELLDYLHADVAATGALYEAIEAECEAHAGIGLDPARLTSAATVASAYLKATGAQPPELGDDIEKAAMCAYLGARAEAPIVRTPVPVVVLDWASMYPTVAHLLGTSRLTTATDVEVVDVTDELQEFLAAPNLREALLDPGPWARWGATLVEVVPDGDPLAHRGVYPNSPDSRLVCNPLSFAGTLWWSWLDVAAAAVTTGKVPTIVRAVQPSPSGPRDDLTPVRLRGGPEVLDPSDPSVALLDARKSAKDAGTTEGDRLAKMWKPTANSAVYGVLARFDPTATGEKPGPLTTPVAASAVTAGARLILALLMAMVERAGGAWAFCDTDSLAVVALPDGGMAACPGGAELSDDGQPAVRALSWGQVERFRDAFTPLRLADDAWKVEHGSYDDRDQPLLAYVLRSKQYVLYRAGRAGGAGLVEVVDAAEHEADGPASEGGPVEVVDPKEHLIGTYLDPLPRPERDWIAEAWAAVVTADTSLAPGDELGELEPPEWGETPAVQKFTVSSPEAAMQLRGIEQVTGRKFRPFTFMLRSDVLRGGDYWRDSAENQDLWKVVVAPYSADPQDWMDASHWTLVTTGRVCDVDDHPRTLGICLERYRSSRGAATSRPTATTGDGLALGRLTPQQVWSSPMLRSVIGKEGRFTTERSTGRRGTAESVQVVKAPEAWADLVVPVLARMGPAEVARRAKLSTADGALSRVLSGKVRPKGPRRRRLRRVALDYAYEQVKSDGWAPEAVLAACLAQPEVPAMSDTCRCGCGEPARGKWVNDSHRKMATHRAPGGGRVVIEFLDGGLPTGGRGRNIRSVV